MGLGILDAMMDRLDLMLLLLLRMIGLFATAPGYSNRIVPVQMRLAVAFAVAMIVSPLFADTPPATTLLELIPLAVQELMVGLVVGFVASLIFSIVQFAGQLLDVNMGLSIVNVLDPLSNLQMPLMGNLFYIMAILFYFSVYGHHMLIEAIVDSYALVPLGSAVLTTAASQTVVAMASKLFVMGLKVAAPVLAALFLTTVALGVLNRAVPQMNVFIVGLPVQLAMGIFMLILILPLYMTFLRLLLREMAGDVLTILRLLGG